MVKTVLFIFAIAREAFNFWTKTVDSPRYPKSFKLSELRPRFRNLIFLTRCKEETCSDNEIFRTEIKIGKIINPQIVLNDTLFFVGSCFAENIGEKLASLKFDVVVNPSGIVYNPLSLAQTLERCLVGSNLTYDDLSSDGELFFSFDHHSCFNNRNADECLSRINQNTANGFHCLKTARAMFITFGSSWAYRRKDNGKVVNNCHKQPQRIFDKFLVSTDDTVRAMAGALEPILSQNTQLSVVLTVSPVRHLKDGGVENSLSKASLIVAAHELCRRFPKRVTYFGAYELVMDDLRDYRFYAPDMLHPSPVAVDYVWTRLEAACFSPTCRPALRRLQRLHAALLHRPRDGQGPAYRQHLVRQQEEVDELSARYPHMAGRLEEERETLRLRLAALSPP